MAANWDQGVYAQDGSLRVTMAGGSFSGDLTGPLGTGDAVDSISVALSVEDRALLSAFGTFDGVLTGPFGTGDAVDSVSITLSNEDRVLLTAIDTKLQALVDDGDETGAVETTASGWGFDVPVQPTVTSGAYTAGDIVGGLIDVTNAARIINECITVVGIQIALKAAVTSNFRVIILSADPTSTTKTDNAAYSLNAADVFKVRKTIQATSFAVNDHGTPNTYGYTGPPFVMAPVSGGRNFYALIVDDTGFTLTSTSDLQIRFTGLGV